MFHPSKPYFFVASQRQVKVYNLAQQTLTKKLLGNVQYISGMDIHPGGDNVIISSYDCRVCWFDLDLSVKPYKTLGYESSNRTTQITQTRPTTPKLDWKKANSFRYHKHAIRATKYHPRYPLFASCSDDGHIHMFHGMVYNDLLQNPFIVPLKILKGHEVVDDLGKYYCVGLLFFF